MSKTIRKGINMSEGMFNWFKDEAKSLGISQSALMVMAMKNYIDQQESLVTLPELMKRIEEQKKLNKEKRTSPGA